MQMPVLMSFESSNLICAACQRRTLLGGRDIGVMGGTEVERETSANELEQLQAEMDDLLVCLGEEERKVMILTEKLSEFGVDGDALLERVRNEEIEDDGLAKLP
jgi:hypothetical protein